MTDASALTRLLPLSLATFAVGTDSFVIAGLLPGISADLKVSTSAAGQLVTFFALTFAISASVFSAVLSGLERGKAMQIALAIFILGNVVTAAGGSYQVVFAGRIIAAIGAGTITSSASTIATVLSAPTHRARAMAMVLGGMSVATALGSPLGIFIGGHDWRLTMWFIVGLSVVTVVWIRLGVPVVSLPATSIRERLAPLGRPHVLAILTTTTLVFTSTYAVYTYIATVLRPVTGGSVQVLTPLLLVYGIGDIAGTFASGRLADWLSAERVLAANLILTWAVLVIGPLATHALPTAAIWVAVWGVCGAAATVPQQLRLVREHTAATPILLGLNSSAIYVGISCGAGFSSIFLLFVRPSYLMPLAAVPTSFALAVIAASTVAVRRRERLSDMVSQEVGE